MNSSKQTGKLACIILMTLLGTSFGFADQTRINKTVKVSNADTVKTNFVADGQLTRKEINQVLELARQCGVPQVSEVRTFHYLPTGRKGITVKSIECVDSRNTSFDSVYLSNTNWGSSFEFNKDVKLVGAFWFIGTKYRTLLRSYQWTNQQPFQVSIGEGVDVTIADKMVDLIITDKLPFAESKKEGSAIFTIPGKPKDLKPTSIGRGDSKDIYEVEFKTQLVFKYRFEKGEFIYIGGYKYVI